MAKAKQRGNDLREPVRGEKTRLIRELLARYPSAGNADLAKRFLDRMQQLGIRDDRNLAKVAQSFSQAKSDAKRRQAASAEINTEPSPSIPEEPAVETRAEAPARAESEGDKELLAVLRAAKEVGGLQRLKALIDEVM
jgi:hypothetical protein